MNPRIIALFLTACALLSSACATKETVADHYEKAIREDSSRSSNRTTILFLVDGLPIQTLVSEFQSGKLPNLYRYFLSKKKEVYAARTGFPSLTYPSIGSLLTEKPVDQTGIYGNIIFKENKKISLDTISDISQLNKLIQDKNIFSRLKDKNLRTVSFDYIFQSGSTAHTDTLDLESGVAYFGRDYNYIDGKTLGSLKDLLLKNSKDKWPDFIFVHLVGVDFTSHDLGPRSKGTYEYLESLDQKMGQVLDLLLQAESQRQIVALLTADHGFDEPVKEFVDLEESIGHFDSNITIFNEGRYLGLTFPKSWSDEKKISFMQAFSKSSYIDIGAYVSGGKIFVESSKLKSSVSFNNDINCGESSFALSVLSSDEKIILTNASWLCADHLDQNTNNLYYPFFISNLSRYFRSPGHPDAILISKSSITFNSKFKGQHGGPTTQEIFIPLLMRNGTLTDTSKVPPLWDILKFL